MNLSRTKIPRILVLARAKPFDRPADCNSLRGEIAALSAVLGPTLSTIAGKNPEGRLAESEIAAWNAARNAAGGMIPFRGVIRWISGADRRDRQVKAAILAGYVRRAYLEGVRDGSLCGLSVSASLPATK